MLIKFKEGFVQFGTILRKCVSRTETELFLTVLLNLVKTSRSYLMVTLMSLKTMACLSVHNAVIAQMLTVIEELSISKTEINRERYLTHSCLSIDNAVSTANLIS